MKLLGKLGVLQVIINKSEANKEDKRDKSSDELRLKGLTKKSKNLSTRINALVNTLQGIPDEEEKGITKILNSVQSLIKGQNFHNKSFLYSPPQADLEKGYLLKEKRSSVEESLIKIESKLGKIENLTIGKAKKLNELRKEHEELVKEEKILLTLIELGVDKTEYLGPSKFLYVIPGTIELEDLDKFKEKIDDTIKKDFEFKFILNKEKKNEKKTRSKIPVLFITSKKYEDKIDRILLDLKFDKFPIQFKEKDLSATQNKIKKIKEEIKTLENSLVEIKKRNYDEILLLKELAGTNVKITDFFTVLEKTWKVYVIDGWIPERNLTELKEKLEIVSRKKFHLEVFEPKKGEFESIPVKLNNPKILKPFEVLTEMFGFPTYNEIDPTPFLAITFPLFFGLMFGDAGAGLILMLLGIFLSKFFGNVNKSYDTGGKIMAYCGISALIFGFLYGDILGIEGIIPSLWIKPTNSIKEMIGLTLFIGVLQINLGFIINSINKLYNKDLNSFISSIGKVWFLGGEITIIAKLFNFPVPLFYELSKSGFLDIFLYSILLPGFLIIIPEVVHKLRKEAKIKNVFISFISGLFEILDIFTLFLSNTISYTRLLILALVHAVMLGALFTIANMLPEPLNIIAIIFGVIAFLILEGFIVFVHTLRLHFYEWFNKFYSGTGIKHKPFKTP